MLSDKYWLFLLYIESDFAKKTIIDTIKMKYLISFTLFIFLWGCSHHSGVDKHLRHSDNVVDVKDLVQEIVIDTPLIGGLSRPYVFDRYFILIDPQSTDNQIHFFDKKDFSYIAGTGHPGEGPHELTNCGEIIPDGINRRIYVPDFGKMKLLSFDLDSILLNPNYLPECIIDINKTETPFVYSYFNDTLCYVCCMTIKPGEYFQESLATWNMKSGEIRPLISGHPEVERKRIRYAVSLENNLIAVSYDHHDLLSIYDLKGNLKHNIYGPEWDNATSNAMIYYYGSIIICNNRIIVGYSGERNPDVGNITVSRLLVYDLEGNYIKTLNVGYNVVLFSYDLEYNRIMMVLDDEIQFAYLDLDGLLG